MSQDIPILKSAFTAGLVDASGQPIMIKNNSQNEEVFWDLFNNQAQPLVVKPLDTKLDENNYNFAFEFDPGVLTKVPTLEGWDVYAQQEDGHIIALYLGLSGKDLSIKPGEHYKAKLTYSDLNPTDPGLNRVSVSLTNQDNVFLGGPPALPSSTYSFFVSLVQGETPMISTPPLAVDFIARRTILNDMSPNEFTFALTNMTEAGLNLTSDVLFTVWFDAEPNNPGQTYPAALARIEDLNSNDFQLQLPDKWKLIPQAKTAVPGNRQWQFKVAESLTLGPQDPTFFKFSTLRTPLDPGISRMYLRFEGLPGFRPGVLLAVLEKTPLQYGSTHGQGLYVSANGNLNGDLTKESGLYVRQAGNGPAAMFNGADQQPDGGTVILGTTSGPTLRFGCKSNLNWIQSHNAPLAINPIPRKVGIGTPTPGSLLSVSGGGVAIGSGYSASNTTIGDNNLAVEGKVGIGITSPGSALSVVGGVAIGHSYATDTTHMAEDNVAIEGKVGVGTTDPGSSLSVAGGAAVGKTYAQKTSRKMPDNDLAVEGKVGIGTNDPSNQLHVESADGVRFSLKGGGQLIIGSNNDKSVQLVAAAPKGSDGSADFMYLGGSEASGKALPKMILNATEVDINATTTAVTGAVTASGMTLSGGLQIKGGNILELGYGVAGKEVSAGKIGYQVWTTDGLDIVGAGSTAGQRKIVLYDNIWVPGNIWQFMQYNQRWMALWPSGTSTGAWYNFGPQSSDRNLKSDIKPVSGGLDKVRQLDAVSFRWNEDALARFTGDIEATVSAGPAATQEEQEETWAAERERRRKELETTRLGVVAQNVETVLPEAVSTDPDGYKVVHYEQLIALLIEAVKEQDKIVTKLQGEINDLKQAIQK